MTKTSKAGRKPKYDYEDQFFLLEVEGLARKGLSDAEIAKNIGLCESQFSRAKKRFSQLVLALKKGRRPLNVIVENALFKRATGFKAKTVVRRWQVVEGDEGNPINVEIVQETETDIPPDTGAAMAWLKNRDPEDWNKQPHKVAATDPTGENQAGLVFVSAESFTEEQIQQFINKNISDQEDNDSTAGGND